MGDLSRQRDEEARLADRYEEDAIALRQIMQGMQQKGESLEHRRQAAVDDETTWRELAQSLREQCSESSAARTRQHALHSEEVARLQEEIASHRLVASEHSIDAERRRRLAAQERHMLL